MRKEYNRGGVHLLIQALPDWYQHPLNATGRLRTSAALLHPVIIGDLDVRIKYMITLVSTFYETITPNTSNHLCKVQRKREERKGTAS
jgi:hypothetical protein